jgi:hypothetical protein
MPYSTIEKGMARKMLEGGGRVDGMSDLAPLQDVAAEFGVGITTLYRYLKTGQLKRYRRAMDRRTYVDRDELRDLVEPKAVSSGERA